MSYAAHGLGRMVDATESARLRQCAPGIAQGVEGDNLGYGNLYYAFVRTLKPQHVLVIGSGQGFTPGLVALALQHNGSGKLTFIDPSMDALRDGPNAAHGGSGTWDTPEQARARFACMGVDEGVATHFKLTNREFFGQWPELGLPPVDFAIIDGAHDYDNVLYDLNQVLAHLRVPGVVLMHDSTHFFNRTGHMGVSEVVRQLRRTDVELVTLPGYAGLTIIRATKPGELLPVRRMPPTPVLLWAAVAVSVGLGVGAWLWR